jgi:hypothetical protein
MVGKGLGAHLAGSVDIKLCTRTVLARSMGAQFFEFFSDYLHGSLSHT